MTDEQAAGWIAALGLAHGPTGAFVRAYAAASGLCMRYVLLTADDPGLAAGPDDRLLFHHAGDPLRIHQDHGGPGVAMLGSPDQFQVGLAGGQALELSGGAWALISEVVLWNEPMAASRWRPALAAPADADLVATLGLAPHVEGGYFRELWAARARVHTPAGPRPLASTIYYLLTTDAPLGRFHRNTSDITHLLHHGGPIVYQLISPAGKWREIVLGRDHEAGQVLAFTCPGGWWKSSQLSAGASAGASAGLNGLNGLISEIVAPGFDYADHEIADEALFTRLFPQLRARWAGCVRATVDAASPPRQ